MQLVWLKTPFSQHDNVLFPFIKKSLADSQIYDDTVEALSWTEKRKKYQLRLSGCNQEVKILVNDIQWLVFDGTVSIDGVFDFYILPALGRNEIKVVSTDGEQLYTSLVFNCYNIHIFLAFLAYRFKKLRNKLQQVFANTYISDNKVQDLDGNNITPDYRYTKSYATLLGTKRYSGLTNSQYYKFLEHVFNMSTNGGTLAGYYELQLALPDYIDRVDIIPLENYLVQRNTLSNKVYVDGTDNRKLKIYPSYVWQSEDMWGMLPYYSGEPDATTNPVFFVYTDGELYDSGNNLGALKIKYTNDAEFFKRETIITDTFYDYDLRTDGTKETVTGFEGAKYVVLRNPAVDGTMISVDTTGQIIVDESAVFIDEPNYNFVDLGSLYEDEIDNVKITYRTYDVPNILAKVEKDSTTGRIINILMSGHFADSTASTGKNLYGEVGDRVYLSYTEENYGSIVLVIRAIQKIDDELKDILNILMRNILPLHLRYYLVFSTVNLWDYWTDTHFIFEDTTSLPQWAGITFYDLK